MARYRLFLIVWLVVLLVYTGLVAADRGFNLLEVFFRDIIRMGWPGQFNLDFLSLLTLSGLWIAWRHRFSAVGMVLGLCGLFGGGVFLMLYLLVASFSAGGDMRVLLLGRQRATLPEQPAT